MSISLITSWFKHHALTNQSLDLKSSDHCDKTYEEQQLSSPAQSSSASQVSWSSVLASSVGSWHHHHLDIISISIIISIVIIMAPTSSPSWRHHHLDISLLAPSSAFSSHQQQHRHQLHLAIIITAIVKSSSSWHHHQHLILTVIIICGICSCNKLVSPDIGRPESTAKSALLVATLCTWMNTLWVQDDEI